MMAAGGRVSMLAVLFLLTGQRDGIGQSRQMGDIGVSVSAMANGNTHHGYVDYRFTLRNNNPERDRRVTIELPSHNNRGSRDSIQRMTRSVNVGAGGILTLSLLQPALPIEGGGGAKIYVNGRDEGGIPLPGGFHHSTTLPGNIPPRPFLVSRALDSSALDTALTKLVGGGTALVVDYGAFQATGGPNVPTGRGGYHANAWMPETAGRTDWLELRYSSKVIPDTLRIYRNGRADCLARAHLYNSTGAIVASVTNASRSVSFDNHFSAHDLSLSGVTQAVDRVRLEFNGKGAFLGVDAVELSGGGVSAFASGATASSSYATRHSRGGRSLDKSEILRSELEVDQWSDNWLAYTAFDLIVLHEGDLGQMPPDVSRAFWQYVEAGGVVAILGKVKYPSYVRLRLDGETPGLRRFHVGFGECLELSATDTRDLNSAELREMDAAGKRTAFVWPAFGDVSSANSVFPVIDNMTIPVRGIALIMLVFIILVGPVNIFVLARMNRRIWMLWTIPTISLSTCAIVFVYSLFSEGITPTVRIESVTLLDPESHRATTLGRAAYYCPLTPSGGLRFDYDTEVFPLVSRAWRDGTPKALDWSNGQHLESGWVQARMPAHFAMRRSEVRRERLQFEEDAEGNWTVMNGLGVPVKRLFLRSDSGGSSNGVSEEWSAGAIVAGARVPLKRNGVSRRGVDRDEALRKLFSDGRWSATSVTNSLEKLVPETGFVAELEGNPFLETGLKGAMHLKSASVLIGYLSKEELAR
jgi:hypothetical protein